MLRYRPKETPEARKDPESMYEEQMRIKLLQAGLSESEAKKWIKRHSTEGTGGSGGKTPRTFQPPGGFLIGNHTAEADTMPRRAIEIPVGRTQELGKEIQSSVEKLRWETDHLRRLEVQISSKGGRLSAPVEDLSARDEREKEVKRLKRVVKALSAERRLQNRYEAELCAFALLRGELSIAGYESLQNEDVLALADRVYPDIFSEESILLGLSPNCLADKFKDMKSIDAEVKRLGELVSAYSSKTKLLQHRLESLQAAKQAVKTPKDSSPALHFSPSPPEVGLPRFSDNATTITDLPLDNGQRLRLSVFQIPAKGGSTGGIVFREMYGVDTMKMARIAITYFRPWHLGSFSLSENPDLAQDLSRLRGRLCKLCKGGLRKKTSSYRLPPCILFMRFYDEMEQLEDRLQTTSLYIPFCRVLKSGSLADDIENVLSESGSLYNCSIPDWVFGELFKRQMVGSDWLHQEDLKYVHRFLTDSVPRKVGYIVHSQFYKLGGEDGSTRDSGGGSEASD